MSKSSRASQSIDDSGPMSSLIYSINMTYPTIPNCKLSAIQQYNESLAIGCVGVISQKNRVTIFWDGTSVGCTPRPSKLIYVSPLMLFYHVDLMAKLKVCEALLKNIIKCKCMISGTYCCRTSPVYPAQKQGIEKTNGRAWCTNVSCVLYSLEFE